MNQSSTRKRMRGPSDETNRPNYAVAECERRWLVDPDAIEASELADPIEIEDRYVEGTRLRLRRMSRDDDHVFKLTRKYECEDPLRRPIVTAYLTSDEYEVLKVLSAQALFKTRYKLSCDGLDFSVDQFGGHLDGLWLSEIEMEDIETLRDLVDPHWTTRDVTHDVSYQGATLARLGRPED